MGAALFLLAPALVLWAAVVIWRCPLVTNCTIYLVVACCLGDYLWTFDAGGFTWTIDRLFTLLLAVAFLVQGKLGRAEIKPFMRLDGLIVGFTALLIVSTFAHDWRTSGEGEDSIVVHLANGYLIPLLIYGIVRNATYDQRQQRICWSILALFGLYLAVTALLEAAGLWNLVFPRYIADPEAGIHWGRARGPMLQSARLGFFLVTCAAVTWLLLTSLSSWGRMRYLLAVCFLPLSAAAMFVTYTRSVWMGAASAVLVMIGMTWRGRWRAAALYCLLVGAAVALTVKGEDLIGFQRETSAQVTRDSAYTRAAFAYVSWQMFLDRPLVGHGFGQFQNNSQYYLSDRQTSLQLEAIRGYINHNTLMNQLAELGVFGPLLFVTILSCWLTCGWRLGRSDDAPRWARRQGLLLLLTFAAYVYQLLFREVSFSPVENALLFYMAGLTVSLYSRYVPETSRPAAQPAARRQPVIHAR